MASQEALIIRIRLSDDDLGNDRDDELVYELENAIEIALAEKHAGYFEGHEFGGGWAIVFFYGESATQLFEAAVPTILQATLRSGSCTVKRHGGPGAHEEVVDLNAGFV